MLCLARYMLSSVRLPVRHTGAHQPKTVEVKTMKFLPYGRPSLVVFAGNFHPEIPTGSP